MHSSYLENSLRELRGEELGMVEAQRRGGEVAEEIQHVAPANSVVEKDAMALLDVLHHVVAVDEDVPGENLAHLLRGETDGVVDGRRHRGLASIWVLAMEVREVIDSKGGSAFAGKSCRGKSISRVEKGSTRCGARQA